MPDQTDRANLLERAESVFSSYISDRDAGKETDFERLCAEHADIEELLRLLHLTYFVGSPVASSAPFQGLLQDRLGGDALGTLSVHFNMQPDATAASPRRSDDGKPRYLIEDEIGRGGMSVILRVWDRDFDRPLAMKVLSSITPTPSSTFPSFDRLERFLEEAQITAQLEHPGIVPVHDCGVDEEGRVFFTMRLVRGEDFRKIIERAGAERAGWNLSRAVAVLVKVCQAVAFGHAKGVVHRDLKPANIMVGPFGETYVMDWGLAKRLGRRDRYAARLRFSPDVTLTTVRAYREEGDGSDDESPDGEVCTAEGAVIGTPVYMSPEQAEGRTDDVDQASDVYSLGAVLYHLISGQLPYVTPGSRVSPLTVLGRILELPPDPIEELNPDAPPELVAICNKAMSRSKADRYRDSLELAEDLQSFLDQRVARSHRSGSRRTWTLATLGLLAVVGLTLAIAAWLPYAFRDREQIDALRTHANLYRLAELEREAGALWPASSVKVGALEDWLRRAQELRAQRTLNDSLPRLEEAIASIETRLAFARTVHKRTINDAWKSWQEAVASIRDECPQYSELEIEPQEGLLPLGRDPDSGLWEFGHLQTGIVPRRDGKGKLELKEESAIVFVLLPRSAAGEAFFLSKHEMTQGQWLRFTGENPAARRESLLHPVETVSWNDCDAVLTRLGLKLPTEAQWQAPGSSGRTPEAPGASSSGSRPVDVTEADARGLCGLRGNVKEWCHDWFLEETAEGETSEPAPASRGKVIRGGSYRVRSGTPLANRDFAGSEYRAPDLGVRPARALDGS